MENNYINLTSKLESLLKKYNITPGYSFSIEHMETGYDKNLVPGYRILDDKLLNKNTPLLVWRANRKFIELRKIVEKEIIKEGRIYRSLCLSAKDLWSIRALLYRELDLCEFIGNGKIVSVKAEIQENSTCNLILKLNNGLIGGIELSLLLPKGNGFQEKHELIGAGGFVSDLVVDTQLNSSSLYCFSNKGYTEYTDIDMELYGLDKNQISLIRSAMLVLEDENLESDWKEQHKRLLTLIETAFVSDKTNKKLNCEVNV